MISIYITYIPLVFSLHHPRSLFTFLVSVVTPCNNIFTSEIWDSDEKEHIVFVFLDLACLSQYESF